MNDKYNDIELAAARTAHKGVPTVTLTYDQVRTMARSMKHSVAAKQLIRDLEHNNSGWCAVIVTKSSYDQGPDLVVVDVEI